MKKTTEYKWRVRWHSQSHVEAVERAPDIYGKLSYKVLFVQASDEGAALLTARHHLENKLEAEVHIKDITLVPEGLGKLLPNLVKS